MDFFQGEALIFMKFFKDLPIFFSSWATFYKGRAIFFSNWQGEDPYFMEVFRGESILFTFRGKRKRYNVGPQPGEAGTDIKYKCEAYMPLKKLLFISFPVKHNTDMCTHKQGHLKAKKLFY